MVTAALLAGCGGTADDGSTPEDATTEVAVHVTQMSAPRVGAMLDILDEGTETAEIAEYIEPSETELPEEAEPTEEAVELEDTQEAVAVSEIQEADTEPAEEESSEVTYTYTDLDKTMYAKRAVNVRTLPSMDGDILGFLAEGDCVTVTGRCNETGWYRFTYNGQTGYSAGNCMTTSKPSITKASETSSASSTKTADTEKSESKTSASTEKSKSETSASTSSADSTKNTTSTDSNSKSSDSSKSSKDSKTSSTSGDTSSTVTNGSGASPTVSNIDKNYGYVSDQTMTVSEFYALVQKFFDTDSNAKKTYVSGSWDCSAFARYFMNNYVIPSLTGSKGNLTGTTTVLATSIGNTVYSVEDVYSKIKGGKATIDDFPDLMPGDLLYFGTYTGGNTVSITHMAIYLGDFTGDGNIYELENNDEKNSGSFLLNGYGSYTGTRIQDFRTNTLKPSNKTRLVYVCRLFEVTEESEEKE